MNKKNIRVNISGMEEHAAKSPKIASHRYIRDLCVEAEKGMKIDDYDTAKKSLNDILKYATDPQISHNPDMRWFAESAALTLKEFEKKEVIEGIELKELSLIPEKGTVRGYEPSEVIIDESVDIPSEIAEKFDTMSEKEVVVVKATKIIDETTEVDFSKEELEDLQEALNSTEGHIVVVSTPEPSIAKQADEIAAEEAVIEELEKEAEEDNGQSPE